jgi:DNA-binding XRE family transcriptional regulator
MTQPDVPTFTVTVGRTRWCWSTAPSKGNSPVPDDLRKIFGQNVRAARIIKAGLTQAQLAARTGLTQQYVSLVEAGLQNITLDAMAALARAVGSDLSALLQKARNRIRPR